MLLNFFQKLDDIFSYLLGNYLNEKKFLKKKIKKNITFIEQMLELFQNLLKIIFQ